MSTVASERLLNVATIRLTVYHLLLLLYSTSLPDTAHKFADRAGFHTEIFQLTYTRQITLKYYMTR